ncbi:proteasomal ubiquitin receptor ADRM1 [Elysia marginata]|uniref:Proteasomal ubiquitin receptor ADRM1 n=1 Tax=Elysia marginata TaxID=1093978 RepID=A0AAV4IZY7_9GAST|nr:proteasomal ubiquitin receptor ADRM1 [Elysia marginata]
MTHYDKKCSSFIPADQDIQNLLGGMSQQQLMQLLGGMGMGGGAQSPGVLGSLIGRPSSAQSTVSEPPLRTQSSAGTRATSADTTPSQPRPVTAAALPSQPTGGDATASSGAGASSRVQLSDLQNILSTMNVPADGAAKEGVDLAKALSPEAMIPILANPGVQERLLPYLPEGGTLPKTEQELRDTVQSPQFQQISQQRFVTSPATIRGILAVSITKFGYMEAFVKAMQEATKKKEDDKDDSMEH